MTQPAQLEYGFAGDGKYGRYYRHSGQLNVGGVLASLAAGLPAGVVMAVAYAALVIYVPFIKLRWIGCVAFGLGLGAVPAGIMRSLKVRNTVVALTVVAVISAAAYYACWVAWESLLVLKSGGSPSPVTLALRPDVVCHFAKRCYKVGTFTLGSSYSSSNHDSTDSAISGPFLGLLWLAEAATILGTAVFFARAAIGSAPFCEKCDRWCDAPTTVRNTAVVDPKTLRAELEAGHFDYVAALGPATAGTFTAFTRHACKGCNGLNTLTVTAHTVVRDKKGRVRKNSKKVLVNKLMVTPEEIARLTPKPAPAPPPLPGGKRGLAGPLQPL